MVPERRLIGVTNLADKFTAMHKRIALGLDLGGSSLKAVAMTAEGEILHQLNRSFDITIPMDWAEKVKEAVIDLNQFLAVPSAVIGLAAPGLVAANTRAIAYMPGRLEGLENFDWTEFLNAPQPIPVLNDAQAALLGEVRGGAAQGETNVILLTLGTGVGGAAMVDGHLLRGAIGRAGHLGHVSLSANLPLNTTNCPGGLEYEIGNYSIGQRSEGRFLNTHDLVKAYEAGDPFAAKVWLYSIECLARAVTSFINILDPETVLIGGGIAGAGRSLFDPLETALRPIEWAAGGHRVRIKPARLGEFAGAIGAAWNALHSS